MLSYTMPISRYEEKTMVNVQANLAVLPGRKGGEKSTRYLRFSLEQRLRVRIDIPTTVQKITSEMLYDRPKQQIQSLD